MPYINELRNHKFLIILVDLLCILAAYIAAFYIRYQGFPAKNWESFVSLLPWILLIGLFFISVYELYALDRKNTLWDILVKIFVAVTFMAFLTMAASYFFREFALPRSILFIASVFTIVLLATWKYVFLKLTRRNVVGKVLFIGDDDNTERMISKIKHPMLKGTSIKQVHPNIPMDKINHYMRHADYIILCTSIQKEKKSMIIYHAMECNKLVYVVPTLYELLLQRSSVTPLDDTMLMSVKPFGLTWDQAFIKRAFDVVTSAFTLICTSPLLPISCNFN
ncbi:BH3651 [Halalkalibacterium halodurans C-125]|uniref:BH3651 protein n=1 Tax=Halalkalibacterium halodurans (strain ATCC BAA-125 / DSM 18197 / FERM 7344 / JCM 9153 / C-125) TaxID=272558 RepID=Q9K6S5_HALH5|nr:hypothetical protein [Halalkalibacterium halodurans]BAB07370.1 BH3651 [Halalkalibacterium halodurans C-125]